MYYFYKMKKETSPIDLTSESEVVGVQSLQNSQVLVISRTEGIPNPNLYPDVSLIEELTPAEAETLTGYTIKEITLNGEA